MPDGQHLVRVVRVVAQVGQHVQGAGADDGGQDDPKEDADEPVGAVAVPLEPPLEIGEAEPEGEGQADAVGVDLERPNVEDDGDRSHGRPGARLRQRRGAVGAAGVRDGRRRRSHRRDAGR